MARDITVTYRCDWCDEVIGEDDGYLDLPFRFGKVDGVIDLCYGCGCGDLQALAEAARPKPTREKGAKRAARHRCQFCGAQYVNPGSLASHVHRKHQGGR